MAIQATFERSTQQTQVKVQAVRTSASRANVNSTGKTKRDLPVIVENLVTLGYPIGRYLRDLDAPNEVWQGIGKVYERMRVAYHQNRIEFNELRPHLVHRLMAVPAPELLEIAGQATPIVPMWQTMVQAESHVRTLKRLTV